MQLSHRSRQLAKRSCQVVLVAALWGCGPSAHESLDEARRELADADYAGAVAAAERGLGRQPDLRSAWGLELVRLEALARAGRADEARRLLERLSKAHPDRVPASQYSATADQLRVAGQGAAAIEVLDMGLRFHPGNAVLQRLIDLASSRDMDPAELEMLRTLGYIE